MAKESLTWVEPPNQNRSPLIVGREILALYRQEYKLTTWDICKLLRCERRWVQDTLRPEIHHICVSHYFRHFIVQHFSLDEHEQDDFNYSSYFYSLKSVEQYWVMNGVATQKTRVIDLADYIDSGSSLESLTREENHYWHCKRSKAEKEKHFERVKEILTAEGYLYYTAAAFQKTSWKSVALPQLPLSKDATALCTKADVRHRQGFKTDTSALKWLTDHGAIRIQLKGKTLWSVTPNLYKFPLSVPVDYYPQVPSSQIKA